jgi:ribonucleotide reductase alpha subunit
MPIHLSENARKVLEVRYLQRDGSGQIIETSEELFQRVARSIAKAEEQFDNSKATGQWEEDFLEMLVHLDFLPNSPTLIELDPLFPHHARQQGFYSERLIQDLQRYGALATIPDVPPSAKDLFRTALEITPEHHLRMQVAFQKHVDNAVSKTINLPQTATPEDIATIYRQAWEWGLKGITVFRYELVASFRHRRTPAH